MSKDPSWMYGSIESTKFIDGILEVCSITVDHQVRMGELIFIANMSNVAMY